MADYYKLVGIKVAPCTFKEWSAGLEADRDEHKIASTDVDGFWVSTAFLGLNHSFDPGKPPLIFETMIFKRSKDNHGPLRELFCERYSTWEEAMNGHLRTCADVRSGAWKPDVEE